MRPSNAEEVIVEARDTSARLLLRWRDESFVQDLDRWSNCWQCREPANQEGIRAADAEQCKAAVEHRRRRRKMAQIDYDVTDHVATIVLNNPEKKNSITLEMYDQLNEAYGDVVSNDDVRVVVITGAGGDSFSTGANIAGYVSHGVLGADAKEQRQPLPKPWPIYKPVIAAIEGWCVGGGLALAAACDLRVATTGSTFGLAGLKRGVVNGQQTTARLTRMLGIGNALDLILLSKWIDGTEAYRIGLAQRLTEPGGAVAEAMDMARTIASFSPDAVQGSKRLAYDGWDLPWGQALVWELEISERSFRTPDALEGHSAFAEKRDPVFGQTPALDSLGFEELWPNADVPTWRS
jgi:enoyl-CoA hydratase/carnithine racemase